MKKKLILVVISSLLIGVGAMASPFNYNPVERTSASTEPTCPEGSYLIGYNKNDPNEPICKLEPTGCPFGDSVPLDKCTPPPDITCNADWTKCTKKEEGSNGGSEVRNPKSAESKEKYSTCGNSGK